jgi:hypothetical protein
MFRFSVFGPRRELGLHRPDFQSMPAHNGLTSTGTYTSPMAKITGNSEVEASESAEQKSPSGPRRQDLTMVNRAGHS